MARTPVAAAGEDLGRQFDRVGGFTVGLEEEVLLVDPTAFHLVPAADRVLRRLGGDRRFKPELPAAQLEIVTTPVADVGAAIAQLRAARRDLIAAAEGVAEIAVVGFHPLAAAEGALAPGARYEQLHRAYGAIARRQLVASLQVHVAVGGADRTLAVYNALRTLLPELAALGANAPYAEGADSGYASVRPTVAGQLPRQGVPPRIASWQRFAAELAWGAAAGAVPEPHWWWWELRPQPRLGTIEIRVLDAQTTLDGAAAAVTVVQALVATLAAEHDRGAPLPDAPTWRIEENRWSALRDGLDGTLADLVTAERRPTRDRLAALLDFIAPAIDRLGAAEFRPQIEASIAANGAVEQRAVVDSDGIGALMPWLIERSRPTAAAA